MKRPKKSKPRLTRRSGIHPLPEPIPMWLGGPLLSITHSPGLVDLIREGATVNIQVTIGHPKQAPHRSSFPSYSSCPW